MEIEVLEILKRFKYENIIVVDDIDYFNPILKSFVNDTTPIYEQIIEKYGENILTKKVNDCEPELIEEIEDYIDNPFKNLAEIKDKINFKYFLSLLDYNSECLVDGNTIWFVDIKMDVGNYEHIKVLYSQFYERNKNKNKNDIFILFSSLASQYDSLEKVNKFLKDKVNLDLDNTFVELNTNIIEKNVIDTNLIYSLILKSSKSKYFDILINSIKKSIIKFKENMYDYNNNLNLFHYDYLTEGKSFDDFLFNVFQYELRCNYVNELDYSIFSFMNNAIDFYLEHNEVDLKKEKILWRISKVINDFENPYLLDSSINVLHHDISFGDVFIIGTNYYMVGNQACDITIRENGERIDLFAILIPLKFDEMDDKKILHYKNTIASRLVDREKFNDDDKGDIKEKIKNLFNLDIKNKGQDLNYSLVKIIDVLYDVKYNSKLRLLSLPFWCLDEASCSTEGNVEFKFEIDNLRYPLKKRVLFAKKEYEKVLCKINDIDIYEFISSAYFIDEKISKIARIGKLSANLADFIYKDFSIHQSRISRDMVPKLNEL